MISWLYRPRKYFKDEPGFGLFLIEIFLIPFYLGIIFNSIFLFLYLLLALIIGVFYFNIRLLIAGIVIIGIVVIAGFGWMIGGILGAIFFAFLAIIGNAGALTLIDSKGLALYENKNTYFIFYIIFLIAVPLLFSGLIFPTVNPVFYITGSPSNLPDSCIGNCFIGQSATDGYYNTQKITINRVFYLKQPYFDPEYTDIKNWHNWDWILLDVSLTNIGSEKPIYYGIGELTDVLNQKNSCFPGGFGGASVELTDFDMYTPIKPGETRRGNISCVIDPNGIKPLKFEYGFDNWYYAESGRGKHSIFLIDIFTPLDYNSIKSSLKGDKPF